MAKITYVPKKFRELIEEEVAKIRDDKLWAIDTRQYEIPHKQLKEVSTDWMEARGNKTRLKSIEKELADAKQQITKLKKKRRKK